MTNGRASFRSGPIPTTRDLDIAGEEREEESRFGHFRKSEMTCWRDGGEVPLTDDVY